MISKRYSSDLLSQDRRLPTLDALRGFALFGIMFVNMTWFTGFAVLSPEQRQQLGTETIDQVTYWLIEVLVAGKFWTIFAFLFGTGAAIQFSKYQNDVLTWKRLYLRRVVILFLLGFAHAVLLWFGDIVGLYAAVGWIVLLMVNRSGKVSLILGLAFLAAPILQMAIQLLLHQYWGDPHATDPGHGPMEMLPAFSTGSYSSVLAANWQFL